jgi:acetolactate synthase-1/2/3 large subunit
MRVADVIWQRLKQETEVVFFLPGGGCGPLVDALGQSGLKAVSCLHEAGVGWAAVAYGQYRGLGVALVTSGPGITNCITPIAAAWVDSSPLLVISGQVMTKSLALPGMRCRGPQEIDAVGITGAITKQSKTVMTPSEALETLEEMIQLCKDGRMGPCVLDVPMDVQNATI